MSGAAMQPVARRRTRKQFDEAEFRALHESAGKLDFTPDFNPAIEQLIRDPKVAMTERVLALLKLQSWGNQSRFAVHDHDRTTAFLEADLARYFGVSRQVINKAVRKLEQRFYLRREDGRLYPVADPEAERERRKGEVVTPGGDNSDPEGRILLALYFERHPDEHPEFQQAKQLFREAAKIIDAFERKAAKEYRVLAVSTPGVQISQNGGTRERQNPEPGEDTNHTPGETAFDPILIGKEELRITSAAAAFSSFVEHHERAREEPPLPPPASGPVVQNTNPQTLPNNDEADKLQDSLETTTGEITDPQTAAELLRRCRVRDPDATVGEIAAVIAERATRKRQPGFGFFLETVPVAFPLRRRSPSHTPNGAPSGDERQEREIEQWRQEQEARLSDPDTSDQERDLIRQVLGLAPELTKAGGQ